MNTQRIIEFHEMVNKYDGNTLDILFSRNNKTEFKVDDFKLLSLELKRIFMLGVGYTTLITDICDDELNFLTKEFEKQCTADFKAFSEEVRLIFIFGVAYTPLVAVLQAETSNS